MNRQLFTFAFVAFLSSAVCTDLQPQPIPTLAPLPTLPPNSLFGDLLKLIPTLGPLPTLAPLDLKIPCVGTTSLQAGSCRSDGNCSAVGGVEDGQCALNLGACCAKAPTCGSTSVLNNTFFSNPDYPKGSSESKICPITITKVSGAIQIRIDFLDVNLKGPDANGRCQTDSVSVDGVNPGTAPLRLCGKLTGQHIYLPVDQTPITSQVTIRVSSSGGENKTWMMKISQITALQGVKAPAGCMQYKFGELQGNITNFNYDVKTQSPLGNIAGMSYSICFRKEAGYCGVRFQPSAPKASNATDATDAISSNSTEIREKRGAPYYTSTNQVGNRPGSYYGRYIQRQPYAAPQQAPYQVPINPKVTVPVAYKPPYASPFEFGWSANNDTNVYATPLRPPTAGKNETEEPTTDIFDVPVDGGMNIPEPKKNVSPCKGQDSVYFPPSDVLCANTGSKDVTVNISPLTVYVDNNGEKHSKGFGFDYNYVVC